MKNQEQSDLNATELIAADSGDMVAVWTAVRTEERGVALNVFHFHLEILSGPGVTCIRAICLGVVPIILRSFEVCDLWQIQGDPKRL